MIVNTLSTLITEKPQLKVLYQDKYLIAIDKPANLFVHRSFLDKNECFFALQLVRDLVGQYVYPLHRLDKPTSGVLVFALSEQVARIMGQEFIAHNISKTYYALTRGYVPSKGIIDRPLKPKLDNIGDKYANKEQELKQAITEYLCIAQASLPYTVGRYNSVRYSLVKLIPKTGRRHQIRRHLAHLRHPIIGDINYGDNKQNPFFVQHFGFKRLMLFAQRISFKHPITGNSVVITADFDPQWQQLFSELNWSTEPDKFN